MNFTMIFPIIFAIIIGNAAADMKLLNLPHSPVFNKDSRIISGKPASVGQFPWQVLIKKNANDDVYCGGSIISANHVLTAAHCTSELESIYMVFGTINIKETPKVMISSKDKISIHPDYNPKNLNNDVSIVKLPETLQFSSTIQPITILENSGNSFVGQKALISGWGYTSDEELEFSDTLLYANVEVITNEQCKEVYGHDNVKESTLCAIGSGGSFESICSGDSGGALVINENGKYIQIGINSFVADSICAEGYPGGFVRLSSFLDFIKKITGI